MRHLVTRKYRLSLGMILAFLLLAILVACGPGEEPTPAPTPTQPGAVATPTPTHPAVVATPTPTTVAPPSPTPTPGVPPQRGGTLNIIDNGYVPNFDIYVTASGSAPSGTKWYAKLHNNLLVNYVYVEEGVECETCSEWHLENQGKTMVFTLIPGIKFQDGREMTSADVKYSLRMIMGDVDGILSPRGGVLKEYVASIETPSKYEVRLNLLRPSPFVPVHLSIEVMMIIPDGTTRKALETNYYGSGPFVLTKRVSGASWSMERNTNYFKPGQPYIDKIEITVVAEEATRVAAFITGRSDYWIGPPGAPPAQYRPQLYKMRDEGKIVLVQGSKATGVSGIFFNTAKPPFNNLKVRKAVNLALDRTILGKVEFGELATVYLLAQAEGMYYGRPDSEVWNVVPGWGTGDKKQQEIEQAKQLVKEAGYPNGLEVPLITAGPLTTTSMGEPYNRCWALQESARSWT